MDSLSIIIERYSKYKFLFNNFRLIDTYYLKLELDFQLLKDKYKIFKII